MTDAQVNATFGKPTHMRTDDFGGTWARYSTVFGYVEIGLDRRTSISDDDKSPVPGRRSLRAYTEKPATEILLMPLRDVVREAERLSRHTDEREIDVYDSGNHVLLQIVIKGGRLGSAELFQHVDR
jgi:hypothetical protein